MVAELDLTKFDSSFNRFEADLKKSLSGLERQFSAVFSGGALRGAEGAFTGIATSATRAAKAVNPLDAELRGIANAANNLRVEYEGGDKAQDQFLIGMRGVIAEAKTFTQGPWAKSRFRAQLQEGDARARLEARARGDSY